MASSAPAIQWNVSEPSSSYKRLKGNCATNGFISSLRSTKREQRLNRKKLRIRCLPETIDENTTLTVIQILKDCLDIDLTSVGIVLAERVPRWDRTLIPRDILVTFENYYGRKYVYNKQLRKSGLPFEIVVELGRERAEIFREAVYFFGEENVFNIAGVIHIITRNRHRHEIRTMWQFRTFLRKISTEMYLTPFHVRNHPDANVYASDTSDDQAVTNYGRGRENRRLQKKLRIRGVPEMSSEIVQCSVIDYIYTNLNMEIVFSDLETCTREEGWDGCTDPRDIVVAFKHKHVQKDVLRSREQIENGRTKILEELTTDMAEIWGEAVKMFGEDKVYINSNNISIDIHGIPHPITSMHFYKQFAKHYANP